MAKKSSKIGMTLFDEEIVALPLQTIKAYAEDRTKLHAALDLLLDTEVIFHSNIKQAIEEELKDVDRIISVWYKLKQKKHESI